MDLEECLLMTDITLQHISAGCPKLERLVGIFLCRLSSELCHLCQSAISTRIPLCKIKFLHAGFAK